MAVEPVGEVVAMVVGSCYPKDLHTAVVAVAEGVGDVLHYKDIKITFFK